MDSRLAIEHAIVRAAFDGHDIVHRITSQIRVEDFSDLPMRRVFSELCRLTDSGVPLDPVLVAEGLTINSNVPGEIALHTIVDLSESPWESAHVDHYCGRLLRYVSCDAAKAIGSQLASMDTVDDSALEDCIARLRDSKRDRVDKVSTMRDATEKAEFNRQNPLAVHSTGFRELDRKLSGGVRDGQLAVGGGRPSVGKSVLLQQIAVASALRGEGALYVSLEMLQDEIAGRIQKSQKGKSCSSLPIYFIDDENDIDAIVSRCKAAVKRHSIRLIVFDYLQLAEVKLAKGSNREQQISAISRKLKRLAMDLQVPVIVGSQLNRDSLKRGKPSLADLRESGAIEQDADIVLLLHKCEDEPETQLIVAKNRAGMTGDLSLNLIGAEFRFAEAEPWTGNL